MPEYILRVIFGESFRREGGRGVYFFKKNRKKKSLPLSMKSQAPPRQTNPVLLWLDHTPPRQIPTLPESTVDSKKSLGLAFHLSLLRQAYSPLFSPRPTRGKSRCPQRWKYIRWGIHVWKWFQPRYVSVFRSLWDVRYDMTGT